MTTQQLIEQLVTEGGAIVTSDNCSIIELADAQATGRFAVDDEGIGFVRRYKEWLALKKARETSPPLVFGDLCPGCGVPINLSAICLCDRKQSEEIRAGVAALQEMIERAWGKLNHAAQARDRVAYHAAFTRIVDLESRLEILEGGGGGGSEPSASEPVEKSNAPISGAPKT